MPIRTPFISSPAFNPSLLSSLLCVVVVITALLLANWQWNRAAYKQQRQQHYQQTLQAPAMSFAAINRDRVLEHRFQRVRVTGERVAGASFLLENQVYRGKRGYHIYSLLQPEKERALILVNHGWIALDQGASALALLNQQLVVYSASTPAATSNRQSALVTLEGRINVIPDIPLALASQQPSASQSTRYVIEREQLQQQFKRQILPIIIQQTTAFDINTVQSWPGYNAKAKMHYGYFIHWLAVALLSIAIYLFFGIKRARRLEGSHE